MSALMAKASKVTGRLPVCSALGGSSVMSAAEVCEPTEGLTSIINESCYAVFRVLVNPLELAQALFLKWEQGF
jgi:hypothetical protein